VGPFCCVTVSSVISLSKGMNSSMMSSRMSPRLPLHPYSQACSSSSGVRTSDCPLPEEDISGLTTHGKPIRAAAAFSSSNDLA